MHIHLPFVVTCSTRKDGSVWMYRSRFNYRFERRRVLQIVWVWWLYIVMSVDKNSWEVFIDDFFSVNNWISRSFAYFNEITTCFFETCFNSFGCVNHILRVGGVCTYRGNF